MIYLVRAEPKHIESLLGRVRRADREELAAGYSLTPERALETGLKISSHCWAGMWQGRVIAIAGLYPTSFLGDHAHPWMIGSHDLERSELRRKFLDMSQAVLAHMLTLYPHLDNWVDARNRTAVRWLRWLGFQVDVPEPHGPLGMPFHHFEMKGASRV